MCQHLDGLLDIPSPSDYIRVSVDVQRSGNQLSPHLVNPQHTQQMTHHVSLQTLAPSVQGFLRAPPPASLSERRMHCGLIAPYPSDASGCPSQLLCHPTRQSVATAINALPPAHQTNLENFDSHFTAQIFTHLLIALDIHLDYHAQGPLNRCCCCT